MSALVTREMLSQAGCATGHVQVKSGENSWGQCRRWVLCDSSDAASARESRGAPNAPRLRAPPCPKTESRRSCFLDLWSTARPCSSMHAPAVSLSHPGSQEHSLRSQPFPFCSPIAQKCYLLSFL